MRRLLEVDARTLGLFRIAFGLLLLANLYDRLGGGDFLAFYTNEGLYPNHYALYAPAAGHYWSLLLGFSSPAGTACAFAGVIAVYALYTLGWQTRWMQLLALVCVLSVDNRFILTQHGGNVVMNLAAAWTVFLPLGERFSLDALVQSLRAHREGSAASLNARAWLPARPVLRARLAYLGLSINFAAIYFFNALHKTGPSWRRDGSVIHYLLWQNRIATPLAAFLRLHEPAFLSPALTGFTLAAEWSLPLLILAPFARKPLRAAAIALVFLLHGGIALLSTLGPFSYAMMALALLLVQPEHWSALARLGGRLPRATLRYREGEPRQRLCARLLSRLDLAGRLSFEDAPRFELQLGTKIWTGRSLLARAGRTLANLLDGLDAPPPRPPPGPLRRALGAAVGSALSLALFAAVASQLLLENAGVPPALRPRSRPDWMTATIETLVIPQGWSLFAPDAPTDDGRLVVDATLADGAHLDLLTGAPPDFEPWRRGPWGFDQQWCEVHARMRGWRQHWRNFRDYLLRRPALLGWPAAQRQRVVALEVFWVASRSPPPGSTLPLPLGKERLFGLRDPL